MPFRNMVLPPKLRSMTQGSVFNFARSDDFNNDVLGMVISARCDLAQNKQEKFIYVPLIKAKTWFDSYLIPKLMEETRKALLSDLKQILVQNGNAESAIDVFGTGRCAELLANPKEHNRYLKKLAELDHIQSCLDKGVNDKSAINPKKISSKIDEVISNKTEGFFLVDNVVDFQNNKCDLGSYVALLGEPRPIHKRAALGISEGLSHDDFNPLDSTYYSVQHAEGEMSYILCTINSPYIELILQRFSSLYSRIGVENPSTTIKDFLMLEALE